MINFKNKIAEVIADELSADITEIKKNIEKPKDTNMGDYAFPCFVLAKALKKAPNVIAEELKGKIEQNEAFKQYVSNVSSINGFLNFTVNKETITKDIIDTFSNDEESFCKSNVGKNKTVLVEYSSPNIAKEFHIGHLKNTIIGHCLYNVYQALGYKTFGLNHLGDYGTQFGKLIEGYKKWGNEYDFSVNPIEKMADLYVRISQLSSEDEQVLEACRENFRLLENGDEFCTEIWKKFKDLSLIEFNEIYDILGVHFDSMIGEAFYSDKMQEIMDALEKNGKVIESQGAKVVDLSDQGIDTPCIIQKTNGSSIYATRDLAAILYRARTYDFDKCLYVVGIEQGLHFKQVFAVARYLGIDEKYTNGLEHVSYGMIRLPEGKMSSRKGNFVTARSLLKETIDSVLEIMKDRDINDKERIAKQIAIGAIVFNNLSENRVKDSVFDLNQALNFNGETGPYLQYMCVRTKSVLKKANYVIDPNIDIDKIQDENSNQIINLLYKFEDTLKTVADKNEPSILARYLIELAQAFGSFYNNNQILCEDERTSKSRLYLTYMVKTVLENGLQIMGIEVPEEM